MEKLIFILTILTIANSLIFPKAKENAKSCTKQEDVESLNNSVNFLIENEYIKSAENIQQIQGLIFGFDSPKHCSEKNETRIKINNIFSKLKDIINLKLNTTGNTTGNCNLSDFVSLENNLIKLIEYFNKTEKDPSCSKRLQKIYITFQSILNNNKIYLKFCSEYQSKYLKNWSNKINQLSVVFVILLKACEEKLSEKSNIIGKQYLIEVDKILKYYEHLNLHSFVEDQDNGLVHIVNSITEYENSSINIAEKLKNLYDFFNWDVILIPKSSYKVTIKKSGNLCGSLELENKQGIVAWCADYKKYNINSTQCIPENEINEIKDFNYRLEIISDDFNKVDASFGYSNNSTFCHRSKIRTDGILWNLVLNFLIIETPIKPYVCISRNPFDYPNKELVIKESLHEKIVKFFKTSHASNLKVELHIFLAFILQFFYLKT